MAFLSEYFNIPGNIKQVFAPFVLDPSNSLNTTPFGKLTSNGEGSVDTTVTASGKTQYFSFRPSTTDVDGDGVVYSGTNLRNEAENSHGFLKILPASFYQNAYINANQDIGNQLGYVNSKTSVTGIDILRTMPYLSIREYQQDSKLNMILGFLDAISQAFQDGSTFAELTKNNSIISIASKVWDSLREALSIDQIEENIRNSLSEANSAGLTKDDVSVLHASDDKYADFVLKFPYAIYYRLISATSMNIYELPYNGKIIWESSGGGFGNGKFGGISMGNEGILGQLVNWFGKNITINTEPTWDGPNDQPVKVDMDFSLYNDTIDAAVKNYIFLTTFLANNKWIQYHMFQHSPSVYDVKIPGVNRLFMCTASIKVEQKGVLRNPALLAGSDGDLDVITMLMTHKNSRYTMSNTDVYKNDLIRIPDVYDVHITFTSLLPNNFNNFLCQFYKNDKLKVISGDKLHQNSYYNILWNTMYNDVKDKFKQNLGL